MWQPRVHVPARLCWVLLLCLPALRSDPAWSEEQAALEQLASAVGSQLKPMDVLEARYGAIVDCSDQSIAELDSNVAPEQQSFRFVDKWMFFWTWERSKKGLCIYLQKPERRGLTRPEAQVFLSAQEMHPPDGPDSRACASAAQIVDTSQQDFASTHAEEAGKADGYRYRIDYVRLPQDSDLLDRAQRRFAADQRASLANEVARIGTKEGMEPILQIDFEGARIGYLASVGGTAKIDLARSTHVGFIMDVSGKKLLAFDDLFLDPAGARAFVVGQAIPLLAKRYKDTYVHGRTQAERASEEQNIDAVIARAVSKRSSEWAVELDLLDTCKPRLRITFDNRAFVPDATTTVDLVISFESISDLITPQIRAATGD